MTNKEPISSECHSRLKRRAKIKEEHKIVILSVVAGLSAYPIDAAIDSVVFSERTFLDQLIFEVSGEEMYFRSVILAMFIIFGIVIAKIVARRKKAEEALGTSEEMYRSIVELASDAIVTVDMKGIVTSCNPATTKMLGCSKNDIIGKHFRKLGFLRTRDIPKYLAKFSSTLIGKVPKPFEAVGHRADGTPILVEVLVSLLRKDGKMTGVQAIARDITERKEAEKVIRESQEKFERLFMSNPEAAVYSDVNDRVLDINPRFSELFGYSSAEAKGQLLDDLIVPDDLKEEGKMLTDIREGYVYHDTVRKKKDGSLIPVSISSASIISENQNLGNIVLYKDITERKQMEEKLRQYSEHLEELVQERTQELSESEKRYSVLVEEASDGVVILQDERIVFANRKAAEVVGYSRDELDGLPLEKLVDEKYLPLAKKMYERNLLGDVSVAFEVEWIAKNGERIPIEVSGARINYNSHPAVLRVARDIRERKRTEEARLRLEKLAAIGELATMVGHDLRNPLQSIENATYYLKNELALKPHSSIQKHEKEMLQAIEDSVNYADKIIRDLQDFSSIKKPTLKKADINTVVKEALTQVKASRNVELRAELNLLPGIEVDEDQMKRVFLNFITNGVQAMENGGKMTISTKKTADFIEVSFRDTGIGIPKENMDKIFKPLFTTKAKGMGMGLAICKKFVESHGGTIQVESEVGRGTTFTVKLPIQHEMEVTAIARE